MQADTGKKEEQNALSRAGIAGASAETVQRYGAAAKEHIVAYTGVDNETGKVLQKSLKSIKAQGTNEKYAFSIEQQKSGWAAEVKDTAATNAENIIAGKGKRKIRHDDLPGVAANDPLYDHVYIDSAGNIVSGSGSQMKFIGSSAKDPTGAGNPERALKQLQSKKFQKYIDNDVKIEVPKDEYQQMQELISKQKDNLQKQLQKAKTAGNAENIAKLEKKLDNLAKLKKNLCPSKITRKQALEAARHPMISTAKSVAGIAHKAGKSSAGMAAAIAGTVSITRNIVAAVKGDVEGTEAVENVVKDVAESATVGYGTGFGGAAIEGLMKNSGSGYVRELAKTNMAGTIVTATVGVAKVLTRYVKGEIDGTQCLEDLGQEGTGMIGQAMGAALGQTMGATLGKTMGAALGQTVLPIPVVGAIVGSMVGYALSSATYGVIMETLKEAKLAREERIAVEAACQEHIKMIREYREQMNVVIEEYLSDMMDVFNESFAGIKDALAIGDVDLMVESANNITSLLGGNRPFENMADFDEKMLQSATFYL